MTMKKLLLQKDVDNICKLIDQGFSVDEAKKLGLNDLLINSIWSPYELDQLIKHGCDVNYRKNDVTPLTYCIKNGAVFVAIHLLDAGARPNDTDIDGKTPLYHAIRNGSVDFYTPNLIDKLFECGATMQNFIIDEPQTDILEFAVRNASAESTGVLFKHGYCDLIDDSTPKLKRAIALAKSMGKKEHVSLISLWMDMHLAKSAIHNVLKISNKNNVLTSHSVF